MESIDYGYFENDPNLFSKSTQAHVGHREWGGSCRTFDPECVIDQRSPQESQQLLMLGTSRPPVLVNQ